eukprot:1142753-Pelagomonas_calceolata.AAC.1
MKGFDMIDNLASNHCGLSMVFEICGRTGSMDTEIARNLKRGEAQHASCACMPIPEEGKQKVQSCKKSAVIRGSSVLFSLIDCLRRTPKSMPCYGRGRLHIKLQSQQHHGTSTCKATFEYNQQLCCRKESMEPCAPEVFSRQGTVSGWTPQPDCLGTPSTAVMEGMVGYHIKKLSAGASLKFDGIPIPLLKYACLPVELGRKVDCVNVLVPLIACMFRVFLSKGRIPVCWKVEKLTPLHKQGAMSNPGNYRIIAISGVMYRIYANVLKDLVADWCFQKDKVSDTQFGFYPGRSTLYPLFILRHLKNALKKIKPQQSPRLHAAFLDLSQAYDT